MIQVWTMRGLRPGRRRRLAGRRRLPALDAAGFTGVVATNCEQTYHRYLRLGERLTSATRLRRRSPGRSGPRSARATSSPGPVTWYAGRRAGGRDDVPGAEVPPAARRRPHRAAASRTRCGRPSAGTPRSSGTASPRASCAIQRCAECGELRHPPGPVCPLLPLGQPRLRRGARAGHGLQLRRAPPPAGARAASRRSSSRWWSCRRACGWWANIVGLPARRRGYRYAGAGDVRRDGRRADPAHVGAREP